MSDWEVRVAENMSGESEAQKVYEKITKILNDSHLSSKDVFGVLENIKVDCILAIIDDEAAKKWLGERKYE
jgi:hypothetical protein